MGVAAFQGRAWVQGPRRDAPPTLTPLREKIDQSPALMSRGGVSGVGNKTMDDKRLRIMKKTDLVLK